jgi:hypothetical protein
MKRGQVGMMVSKETCEKSLVSMFKALQIPPVLYYDLVANRTRDQLRYPWTNDLLRALVLKR